MIPRALFAIAFAWALAGCDRNPPPRAAGTPLPPVPGAAANAAKPAAPTVPPVGDSDATEIAPADLAAPATYSLPGALSSATTEAWLRQRFGDANVQVADVPRGEGESSRGIILFPDDPTRRAYLYFQDAGRLRGLSLVRVIDEHSRWRLENGIGIGTRLSELVAINGKPLRLSGFDWDYGGAISDWNGGRLQPSESDPRRPVIRLRHGPAPDGAYPMGDAVFSSDDPRYPRLGDIAFVGEIAMSFPGEDDL